MRRSSRSSRSRSSRSSSQQGWFIIGFRQNQNWIILALSRATINSDVRVSSRQHCSSCTVMCHRWQTAACPWLVSMISPSLACRSKLCSSLLSIMWSYAMGILCNSLQCRWLINQPKNFKNVSKRVVPFNEGFYANKDKNVVQWNKMKEGFGVIQLHLNNSSASSTPLSHLSSTTDDFDVVDDSKWRKNNIDYMSMLVWLIRKLGYHSS